MPATAMVAVFACGQQRTTILTTISITAIYMRIHLRIIPPRAHRRAAAVASNTIRKYILRNYKQNIATIFGFT